MVNPIGSGGSGSGSGLRVVRSFSAATLAAARTARDTYYTANPTELAELDANTNLLIRLDETTGNTSEWEFRLSNAWSVANNVAQGERGPRGDPGSDAAIPAAASQAEATAGAETGLRSWSPLRIRQAARATINLVVPQRWRNLFAGDASTLAPESGEVLKVNDGGVLVYGDVEEANLARDLSERLLSSSATNDQIMRYDGAAWQAEDLPDESFTAVESDATLSGTGVSGSPLSVTTPYTSSEKSKLAGIAAGAEVNAEVDWDATSGDGAIANKPDIAEIARDAVGAALRAGTNVTNIDVNDSNNTITINAATQAGQGGGGLNAEQVRDTIAAALRGSLPISVTHDDGNNTLTISIATATTSTSGIMSNADKTKLEGIAANAEVNVNADWDATSGDAQILNKPTIPAALQRPTDAELRTGTSNVIRGYAPTDVNTQIEYERDPDYSQSVDRTTGTRKVRTSAADISTIVDEAQTQSDWTQSTTTNPAYIQNKPTVYNQGQIEEFARDAVAAALTEGANVTITTDDSNDTITIAATGGSGGGGLDAEAVRDTIAAALQGTAPITVTHNDSANTITIAVATATQTAAGIMSSSDKTKLDGIATGAEVNEQSDWNATTGDSFIRNKPTVYTQAQIEELARDAVGAALVGGANIVISVDDGNDRITISEGTGAGNAHTSTRYVSSSDTTTITDAALTSGTYFASSTTAQVTWPTMRSGYSYLFVAVPDSTGDVTGIQQAGGGSLGLITNLTRIPGTRTLNSVVYKVWRTTDAWPQSFAGTECTIEQA